MRILLTGANGLLGQHLLSLLTAKKAHDIIATGMGANRNSIGHYKYYSCDLTQKEQVNGLIDQVKPEYIIHAAAKTQVDWCENNKSQCWDSNVGATEFLIEASLRCANHFQYISTDFVFDGKRGNYSESDNPNPVNYYGETKLAAERLVRSCGIHWSIARTVLVYGVSNQLSRSNILTWIWKSLKNQQNIQVVTDQVRTPTFVEDLAMGSNLIMEKQAEGIYHISGDEIMTPFDLALKTAEHFNFDKRLITPVDASVFSQDGKRPEKTGFIIEKARKNLGFDPTPIKYALDTLEAKLKRFSS